MTAISFTLLLIQLITAGTAGTSAAEASARLTGWLNTVWADWGEGQSARFFYLAEADGKWTRLLVDESLLPGHPISSGIPCRVIVKGFWREDAAGRTLAATDLEVDRSSVSADALVGSGESSSAIVFGSQPWLVILCKFSDVPEEPRSVSDYQALLSSSYPGMDHFWREVSYNRINLGGSRVVGWYTLPSPRSSYLYGSLPLFDTGTSFADAIRLADPYVNFTSYAGITLVFNGFLGA